MVAALRARARRKEAVQSGTAQEGLCQSACAAQGGGAVAVCESCVVFSAELCFRACARFQVHCFCSLPMSLRKVPLEVGMGVFYNRLLHASL